SPRVRGGAWFGSSASATNAAHQIASAGSRSWPSRGAARGARATVRFGAATVIARYLFSPGPGTAGHIGPRLYHARPRAISGSATDHAPAEMRTALRRTRALADEL